MELVIQSMGQWAGNGNWRADIQCESTEDFLALPTEIMVDNRLFKKDAYNKENKTAFYVSKITAVPVSSNTKGTFEIMDVPDPSIKGIEGVRRTIVTVE